MSFLATLGGIATGAADLLSPILGYKSNKETNNANKEIAQMNNEWSERMMEKQNAMNIDQWNREKQFALEQRDYESATQQASRLRAAGLNPNLVMSGQNAGSAASTPSGSSVGLPSPSSATMQPYDFSGVARAFESAINIAMALERNEAEVNNLKSQSNYNNAKTTFEAAEAFERTNNYKIRNEIEGFMKQINYDVQQSVIGRNRAQESLFNAQDDYTRAQQRYQELINDNVPDKLALEMSLLKGQLNQTDIAKRIYDYERLTGDKLSISAKKALFGLDSLGEFGGKLVNLRPKSHKSYHTTYDNSNRNTYIRNNGQ